MLSTKIIYLFLFLIFILVIILVARIFLDPSTSTQPEPIKVFEPISTKPKQALQSNLTIISTNLTAKPIGVTQTITFKFNRPVDNETLSLQINPEEDVLPLFDQTLTELTLEPSNTWGFDKSYSVKIFRTTKSKDGYSLDKDYEFKFQTLPYSGI